MTDAYEWDQNNDLVIEVITNYADIEILHFRFDGMVTKPAIVTKKNSREIMRMLFTYQKVDMI